MLPRRTVTRTSARIIAYTDFVLGVPSKVSRDAGLFRGVVERTVDVVPVRIMRRDASFVVRFPNEACLDAAIFSRIRVRGVASVGGSVAVPALLQQNTSSLSSVRCKCQQCHHQHSNTNSRQLHIVELPKKTAAVACLPRTDVVVLSKFSLA
jgi:hypothetical protein